MVCCIMMATTVCNAQNLTGSGTESEPYLISTQSDLETFAKDVNSGISYKGQFIKLTDNIKCDYDENNQWTPIGNYDNRFQGTFDGNGKTISGLYFDNSDQNYVGLFGYNEGTIKNVGVVDSYFNGYKSIGGVCGDNYNATITNCYYLSDTDKGNDAKTQEQFNNGCVAYLLSQGNNGGVWGQDLSKDNLPMLNGSKVYKNTCEDVLLGYSNEDKSYEKHEYENGICKHCGLYQPADINTDGYYEIANAGNLYWFAQYVNKLGDNLKANAILANDIVVNTLEFKDGEIVTDGKDYRVWSPIGNDYDKSFQGTFNGNGHTISGLYFNNSNQNYVYEEGGFYKFNGKFINDVFYIEDCFCNKWDSSFLSKIYSTQFLKYFAGESLKVSITVFELLLLLLVIGKLIVLNVSGFFSFKYIF